MRLYSNVLTSATCLLMPLVASAQSFSNTSLDNKLGGDKVSGTFLDATGETGGAVESTSSSVIQIIVAVCVFIGFILVGKALYDIYLVSKPTSSQDGYKGPVITILVGSALAILPVIAFVSSNSVQSLT